MLVLCNILLYHIFMVLDIIIAVIVITAMVFGYRSGFLWSFLHMIGWLLSVVLAFVWAPKLNDLIRSNTGIYDALYANLTGRFADAMSLERISAGLPGILKETVNSLAKLAAEAMGASVADLIFAIITFILALIFIKLILFLLMHLLSKKFHSGARGVIDGIAGLLIGFVKGIFIVFVLLAIMIPIVSLIDIKLIGFINDWLDSSRVAGTLYDNNILVLIVRDFLV